MVTFILQSTADFIVCHDRAVIQGFNTSGGMFAGFKPANKSGSRITLHAKMLAGGGYTDTASVKAALDYFTLVKTKAAYTP